MGTNYFHLECFVPTDGSAVLKGVKKSPPSRGRAGEAEKGTMHLVSYFETGVLFIPCARRVSNPRSPPSKGRVGRGRRVIRFESGITLYKYVLPNGVFI